MPLFTKSSRARNSRAALRRRAAETERACLGRELHDGIMQGLTAIDLQLEASLRGSPDDAKALAKTVASVQARIREELAGLGAVIEECRTSDVTATRLSESICEVVWRFNRSGDIAAACLTPPAREVIRLPRRVCSELVRIVREALVNVRRHSGAQNVVVEFACNHTGYSLSVTDDGTGLIGRRPPVIISERVHNIGGTLTLAPVARGTRIVVEIPREGPWKHLVSHESRWRTTIRFFGTGLKHFWPQSPASKWLAKRATATKPFG
jgi:signal transduction histidine kinase